jgi:hypothetical protein
VSNQLRYYQRATYDGRELESYGELLLFSSTAARVWTSRPKLFSRTQTTLQRLNLLYAANAKLPVGAKEAPSFFLQSLLRLVASPADDGRVWPRVQPHAEDNCGRRESCIPAAGAILERHSATGGRLRQCSTRVDFCKALMLRSQKGQLHAEATPGTHQGSSQPSIWRA